jgi:membrane fusion protein (multidrug efflux system)
MAEPEKQNDQSPQEKNEEQPPEKKVDPAEAKRRKLRAMLILGLVLIVALTVGILYWLHARHFESSDDAFIDGHNAQVAPQIAGPVIRLLVTDNEEVKAGQTLFEIDPRDEQVKLTQMRAAQLAAVAKAHVAAANMNKSQRDLERYKATDARAVSRQQLDSATAQAESDAATFESANAAVTQADADVAAAELQLSYTTVKAPQSGRVTRRTVEVGNYLTVGQPSLAIVSDDLWVTANFKETQLDYMKVGQKVVIKVDAYPDAVITGHIDSLQSGTGSVFSSLPAENATGNYVKIVQRVPVKIDIDRIQQRKGQVVRLAPGLSVEPKVTVR